MTDNGAKETRGHRGRVFWGVLLVLALLVAVAGAALAFSGGASGWLTTVSALCTAFVAVMQLRAIRSRRS